MLRVLAFRRVPLAIFAGMCCVRAAADVMIENESFRLVLSDAGCATSLVSKETGEECLAKGVKMPF